MKDIYVDYFKKFIKICCGFFACALAIVVSIQATLGLAPWDVFHMGISMNTGISFGIINVATGFIILAIDVLLKEKIGIGTVFNMILIGIFADIIISWNIIPVFTGMPMCLCMIILSVFLEAFGTYLYIPTGLGGGPRDTLMLALLHQFKIPIHIGRSLISGAALLAGWLLGGPVGIGTVVAVVLSGPSLGIVFKFFQFDINTVRHESIKDTLQTLKPADYMT